MFEQTLKNSLANDGVLDTYKMKTAGDGRAEENNLATNDVLDTRKNENH